MQQLRYHSQIMDVNILKYETQSDQNSFYGLSAFRENIYSNSSLETWLLTIFCLLYSLRQNQFGCKLLEKQSSEKLK